MMYMFLYCPFWPAHYHFQFSSVLLNSLSILVSAIKSIILGRNSLSILVSAIKSIILGDHSLYNSASVIETLINSSNATDMHAKSITYGE